MKPCFPVVSNNTEKFLAYRAQMARFKLAQKDGFYFEGIFILYAMMEDRLSAFLFHAGVVNNSRLKITTNRRVKPDLTTIINPEGKNQYNLRNISHKRKVIQLIMEWSKTYQLNETSSDYKDMLAKQINRTPDLEGMPPTLSGIQDWCNSRNELVHALLNKGLESQNEKLCALTEDGFTYCRKLDNIVRAFKRRNTIRKQLKIQ